MDSNHKLCDKSQGRPPVFPVRSVGSIRFREARIGLTEGGTEVGG
jgi:hypothetical protein